ncbi:hypothetical protein [Desulforhopalus sp. IMCC35007]|uniref:hypothetical protein n=1 Tax=Desulforhopalus sp. IMCC35007 TaxID=2569543 RepID=UPI0010AECF28|nr:hypothetical protein [Desulforhopalus sp. IMCC35007]TKB11571.1 hypothetical protein FCL48_01860 [Desulforhopalus sp. IMCC35007]
MIGVSSYKYLLDNEGITEELKNSFLVYLMSHNRPMAELLDPSPKDIAEVYKREFIGMTSDEVSLEELYQSRHNLLGQVHDLLKEGDKEFLLSVKSGEPNWSLFAHPEVSMLPSIQWKIYNIAHMTIQNREKAFSKLQTILTDGPRKM